MNALWKNYKVLVSISLILSPFLPMLLGVILGFGFLYSLLGFFAIVSTIGVLIPTIGFLITCNIKINLKPVFADRVFFSNLILLGLLNFYFIFTYLPDGYKWLGTKPTWVLIISSVVTYILILYFSAKTRKDNEKIWVSHWLLWLWLFSFLPLFRRTPLNMKTQSNKFSWNI